MSPFVAALLRIPTPGAGQTPLTAGASSTVATALPTGARKIWIKGTQKVHVIFGASDVAAATTSEQYLTADIDYVLDVPDGVTHYRAIRGGSSDSVINVVAVNP